MHAAGDPRPGLRSRPAAECLRRSEPGRRAALGPRLDRPPTHSELLGNSNGFGFGWKDQNIYRLGLRYVASPRWTWRTGFNYSPSQIAPSQMTFALLSPAFMERSLHYDALTPTSVQQLARLGEQHGMKALLAVNQAAMQAEARDADALAAGEPRQRITMGVYFYAEPTEADPEPRP